ncbi:MAG: hypothetical protein ABL973_11185 [Micropepsaceae bacterium]
MFEYDDIRRFYEENPDEHVMFRGEEVVKRAISSGVFFLALDTDKDSTNRIFGASAVYDVPCQDDKGGSLLLKEAGGSLVAPSYRGFGIHKVFHHLRMLHEQVLDKNGCDAHFGAIICPNKESESNILKAGFEPWHEVPAALVNERAPFAKEGQEIRFFKFNKDNIVQQAALLLKAEYRGNVSRDYNGSNEAVPLVLDVELLKHYRPVIEQLARGDLSALR